MTAIAGVIDKGRVWIGGDSAGVGGYSLHLRRDPKVFVKDEFLIGYTSSFRMGQILRFYLAPAKPAEGQDDFEYMVCSFVPSVRCCLKEHGFLETKDGKESIGVFLVGRRGKLYLIDSDMQVAELLSPFAACGCGQDLVLGSLHSTEQYDIPPDERIRLALAAAESFSAGVRAPFTVLSIP
jgi:hypothetical protein